MPDSLSSSAPSDAARVHGVSLADEQAESWVRRIQAGLSIDEEVELAEWLQADARHEPSLRKYQAAWDRFEPLARAVQARSLTGFDDLKAARSCTMHPRSGKGSKDAGRSRQGVYRWIVPACGLAAALAFALFLFPRGRALPGGTPVALPGLCEQRILDDGTVVELNRGAEIAVAFTAAERRVRLDRGEASFSVAPNPGRPFVVTAAGIEVRAVGTAFNVRFDSNSLEVVVTEGKVRLASRFAGGADVETAVPASAGESGTGGTFVTVGESAVVGLAPSAPPAQVAALSPAELEERLAWQPRLLDFDDAPLSAIVAEFNRRNPVRLVVTDPVVANRRMTASFRSDNIEAFVRLLESTIGVQARRLGDAEIVLVRR